MPLYRLTRHLALALLLNYWKSSVVNLLSLIFLMFGTMYM